MFAPCSTPRVTLKTSIYVIEEPSTGLCLRVPPAPAPDQPPQPPRLTPRAVATWFPTHEAAAATFAALLGAAPLDIVRVDA